MTSAAARDMAFLRGQLASHGILLDEPRRPLLSRAAIEPVAVDRDEVRRILLERGAREQDLEWLTASCPDLEAAAAFVPMHGGER